MDDKYLELDDNSKKEIKIKENCSGFDIIQKIIEKHNIDMNLYFVYSFKVKEGSWDTSALKRDQELT